MAAPVVLLAVLVALAAGWASSARAVPTAPGPLLGAAAGRAVTVAHTTRRWRLAGVAVGLAAGVGTAAAGSLGRGLLLAGPVTALCVLAGVVVGELRVPAPAGAVRSASLGTRRARDVAPARLAGTVAAAAAALAALLVATTAAGSPDDLGRAGRSLTRVCSPVLSESAGPWPGSYYTVPVALTVAAGFLMAGWALHRVARRPLDAADGDADGVLRRASATAVVAAGGLLVGVPATGVALVAAAAIGNTGCRPAWWTAAAVGLAVLGLAAAGLAAWCAGVLLRTTAPVPVRAAG